MNFLLNGGANMLEKVAKAIEQIAKEGAGAVSLVASYQPKTPACLLKEDEE